MNVWYHKYMSNKNISALIKLVLGLFICISLFGCQEKEDIQIVDPEIGIDIEPQAILEPIEEEPQYSYTVSLHALDEGYDVYSPPEGANGYRYGPSIMYYEDGSMDAWFSRPGNNSTMWDYISYRHSDDGIEWSDEEIVLRPTAGADDHYSCCDPGVIYFNGYYYLGYTSARSSKNGGEDNCAFVARSENPNGPFEKWDGEGWGGDPVAIIEYDEDPNFWGAGELSFVVKDEDLFIYCSWDNSAGNYTRVYKADLVENWPATIRYKNYDLPHEKGQDSLDVAYVEEYDTFIGVAVCFRYTEASCLTIYNSSDGIHFEEVDTISHNIHEYCHNCGLSKMPNGHIDRDDKLVLGYAYGSKWGRWYTRFHEVELDVTKERIS